MTYSPETGGQILFVGGPKDANFIWIKAHANEVVVAEMKDHNGWNIERTKSSLGLCAVQLQRINVVFHAARIR